ncbi:hypothetical protein [Actinomadura sediminis]|uniref:Uncharacterized protein n=1 Tax=Actinomadura sediminis TaxID=1038904 RepID=A0ABW3EFU9_9ACTN
MVLLAIRREAEQEGGRFLIGRPVRVRRAVSSILQATAVPVSRGATWPAA